MASAAPQRFLETSLIVSATGLISALTILQGDLQTCSYQAPNLVPAGTCTVHWPLIFNALAVGLVSGAIHFLTTHVQETKNQIASLQTATATTPPPAGSAMLAGGDTIVKTTLVDPKG